MNYITEINSFYIWLTGNHISGNAQALWHRLMAYCNSFGWKSDFTISNMRLADDIGVSRQELDRLRNKLVQKGLITYKKGIGNQCGKYTMVSLSKIVTQSITQDVTQLVTQSDTQDVTQSGHNALPLNKLNETKLNNKKDTKKTFTPPTVQEVREYCRERGNGVDADKWHNFYLAKGWLVGKNKMIDWQAAVRTWEEKPKKKKEVILT